MINQAQTLLLEATVQLDGSYLIEQQQIRIQKEILAQFLQGVALPETIAFTAAAFAAVQSLITATGSTLLKQKAITASEPTTPISNLEIDDDNISVLSSTSSSATELLNLTQPTELEFFADATDPTRLIAISPEKDNINNSPELKNRRLTPISRSPSPASSISSSFDTNSLPTSNILASNFTTPHAKYSPFPLLDPTATPSNTSAKKSIFIPEDELPPPPLATYSPSLSPNTPTTLVSGGPDLLAAAAQLSAVKKIIPEQETPAPSLEYDVELFAEFEKDINDILLPNEIITKITLSKLIEQSQTADQFLIALKLNVKEKNATIAEIISPYFDNISEQELTNIAAAITLNKFNDAHGKSPAIVREILACINEKKRLENINRLEPFITEENVLFPLTVLLAQQSAIGITIKEKENLLRENYQQVLPNLKKLTPNVLVDTVLLIAQTDQYGYTLKHLLTDHAVTAKLEGQQEGEDTFGSDKILQMLTFVAENEDIARKEGNTEALKNFGAIRARILSTQKRLDGTNYGKRLFLTEKDKLSDGERERTYKALKDCLISGTSFSVSFLTQPGQGLQILKTLYPAPKDFLSHLVTMAVAATQQLADPNLTQDKKNNLIKTRNFCLEQVRSRLLVGGEPLLSFEDLITLLSSSNLSSSNINLFAATIFDRYKENVGTIFPKIVTDLDTTKDPIQLQALTNVFKYLAINWQDAICVPNMQQTLVKAIALGFDGSVELARVVAQTLPAVVDDTFNTVVAKLQTAIYGTRDEINKFSTNQITNLVNIFDCLVNPQQGQLFASVTQDILGQAIALGLGGSIKLAQNSTLLDSTGVRALFKYTTINHKTLDGSADKQKDILIRLNSRLDQPHIAKVVADNFNAIYANLEEPCLTAILNSAAVTTHLEENPAIVTTTINALFALTQDKNISATDKAQLDNKITLFIDKYLFLGNEQDVLNRLVGLATNTSKPAQLTFIDPITIQKLTNKLVTLSFDEYIFGILKKITEGAQLSDKDKGNIWTEGVRFEGVSYAGPAEKEKLAAITKNIQVIIANANEQRKATTTHITPPILNSQLFKDWVAAVCATATPETKALARALLTNLITLNIPEVNAVLAVNPDVIALVTDAPITVTTPSASVIAAPAPFSSASSSSAIASPADTHLSNSLMESMTYVNSRQALLNDEIGKLEVFVHNLQDAQLLQAEVNKLLDSIIPILATKVVVQKSQLTAYNNAQEHIDTFIKGFQEKYPFCCDGAAIVIKSSATTPARLYINPKIKEFFIDLSQKAHAVAETKNQRKTSEVQELQELQQQMQRLKTIEQALTGIKESLAREKEIKLQSVEIPPDANLAALSLKEIPIVMGNLETLELLGLTKNESKQNFGQKHNDLRQTAENIREEVLKALGNHNILEWTPPELNNMITETNQAEQTARMAKTDFDKTVTTIDVILNEVAGTKAQLGAIQTIKENHKQLDAFQKTVIGRKAELENDKTQIIPINTDLTSLSSDQLQEKASDLERLITRTTNLTGGMNIGNLANEAVQKIQAQLGILGVNVDIQEQLDQAPSSPRPGHLVIPLQGRQSPITVQQANPIPINAEINLTSAKAKQLTVSTTLEGIDKIAKDLVPLKRNIKSMLELKEQMQIAATKQEQIFAISEDLTAQKLNFEQQINEIAPTNALEALQAQKINLEKLFNTAKEAVSRVIVTQAREERKCILEGFNSASNTAKLLLQALKPNGNILPKDKLYAMQTTVNGLSEQVQVKQLDIDKTAQELQKILDNINQKKMRLNNQIDAITRRSQSSQLASPSRVSSPLQVSPPSPVPSIVEHPSPPVSPMPSVKESLSPPPSRAPSPSVSPVPSVTETPSPFQRIKKRIARMVHIEDPTEAPKVVLYEQQPLLAKIQHSSLPNSGQRSSSAAILGNGGLNIPIPPPPPIPMEQLTAYENKEKLKEAIQIAKASFEKCTLPRLGKRIKGLQSSQKDIPEHLIELQINISNVQVISGFVLVIFQGIIETAENKGLQVEKEVKPILKNLLEAIGNIYSTCKSNNDLQKCTSPQLLTESPTKQYPANNEAPQQSTMSGEDNPVLWR